MADFDSSLPVRTQTNGDVAVKVVDGTLTSQALSIDASGKVFAKLNDGAGNNITSQANGAQQALDVGINVAGVQIDPRQIRALTLADVVTANQGIKNASHTQAWWTRLSDGTNDSVLLATGELTVAITQPLPAGTSLIGDVRSRTQDGAGTAITSTLINSKQRLDVDLASEGVTGSAVPFNTLQIGGSDGTNLRAAKTDTTGRFIVDIQNAAGEFTTANPLPVTIEDSPGTHINDYKDASSIAIGASDDHDYTVTAAKTLYLTQIEASASGKAKALVQIETGVATGIFTTKFGMFNSTAAPNMSLKISQSIAVAAGVRVRVTMTNRDIGAEDLYSTISGFEL